MPDTTLPTHVKFFQNHRPMMDAGLYSITIDGTIEHEKIKSNNKASLTRRFAVFGERYALNDQDIQAVFPAAGSTGEYASILPHIILNRSTLPWERLAQPILSTDTEKQKKSKKETPWLALLLFDETETPAKKVVSVKDLGTATDGSGFFPAQQKEPAQHDDEQLTVIDVGKDLLQKILPSLASLKLLAHTRQGVNDADELTGDENAVVFCNRLPAQGGRSTMHLVSLEGRYDDNGFVYQGSGNLFRLVSLKSWEFYTTEHFKITTERLTKAPAADRGKLSALLDREFAGTETLFVQSVKDETGADIAGYRAVFKFDKTFDGLLKNLNKDLLTLRLPKSTNATAENYLSQGLVPLTHHFRNGDQSVSWYRGPFLPFRSGPANDGLAIRNLRPEGADELLQFDAAKGMFDVSYSAAWEVGRMLALASKDFSVNLFQWKRLIAQHGHKASQVAGNEHLPIFAHSHNHEREVPIWELHLRPWLEKLASFQSIPANYILPSEQLLPTESIRFFYVDKNWQTAVLSGAFSIGGDWDAESQSDDNAFNDFLRLEDTYLTGFLLRSDVVAGWPGILIDGLDAAQKTHIPLRRQLSRDVLLCLFKAEIKQVAFHQKSEVMHFGLMKLNELFFKQVRDLDGKEETDPSKAKPVDWQTSAEARVIDIFKLATALGKGGNPAQFAMNMIEGVPRVIFDIDRDSG